MRKSCVPLLFILILVFSIFTFDAAFCEDVKAGKHETGKMKWEGRERTFWVYTPRNAKDSKKIPLILCLHGGGGAGKGMIKLTRMGFERIADREGFIIVYPDGVERRWNDGRGIQRYRAHKEGIDDVGFLSALIDRMVKIRNVDPRRVYMTGASNGALMSFRMALEAPEKIAAIGPVICSMGEEIYSKKKPKMPVPVVMLNGTEDPLAPYNGGGIGFRRQRRKLGKILSTKKTAEIWAKYNECKFPPKVKKLPDKDPKDGTWVEKIVYPDGKDGTEVIVYKIIGGGHTWPKGRQYLPVKIIGKTTNDIDGCKVIWEFFKRHSR